MKSCSSIYSALVTIMRPPAMYLVTLGFFFDAASFSGFFIRRLAILLGIGGQISARSAAKSILRP